MFNPISELDQNQRKEFYCHSKFFDILKQKFILKILSYCDLSTLFKFATISRKARFLIPIFLKNEDWVRKFKVINQTIWYDEKAYYTIDALFKIHKRFNQLKLEEDFLQSIINNFNSEVFKDKDKVTELLQLGLNLKMNSKLNNEQVIQILQEKGLFNVFSFINNNYLVPVNNQIELPKQLDNTSTPIHQFASELYQYLKIAIQNKSSYTEQVKMANLLKRINYYQKVNQYQKELIYEYEKSMLAFNKESNVLNYLNKNNIQLIIPFLTIKQICSLLRSNKILKNITLFGIKTKIEYLITQRQSKLIQYNLDENLSKMIVYLLHFDWYAIFHQNVIKPYCLSTPPIRDAYQILFNLLNRSQEYVESYFEEQDEDYYSCYSYCKINHELNEINPKCIVEIEDYLSKYKDSEIESGAYIKIENRYLIQDSIYLQKYMKGLQMFILNNLTYEQLLMTKQTYLDQIFATDSLIYKYSKICRFQQEYLIVLEKDKQQITPIRKIVFKVKPRSLFKDE